VEFLLQIALVSDFVSALIDLFKMTGLHEIRKTSIAGPHQELPNPETTVVPINLLKKTLFCQLNTKIRPISAF